MNTPLTLTPKEAAAQLGMSADQVRRMCASGEIAVITKHRSDGQPRYRIPQSAIDGWLQRNTQPAAV